MIDESARLSRSVDVASVSFDQIMRLLRTYTRQVLLADENFQRLGVNPSLQAQFLRLIERAEQRKDPDPAGCQADRVAAWELQMSLPLGSRESHPAAVVVLCMYDRDSAEFDIFGPDAMFESIMTSVCALSAGACEGFVDFAIAHLGNTPL